MSGKILSDKNILVRRNFIIKGKKGPLQQGEHRAYKVLRK